MNIRRLLAYPAALVAMLAVDAVWLTLAGPRLYQPALGDLLAPQFAPVPAILFYLLFVAGVVVLTRASTAAGATARGLLFGLCAYGTYDLTNEATLRQWPVYLTLADLTWGALLTAFTAYVAFRVGGAAPAKMR